MRRQLYFWHHRHPEIAAFLAALVLIVTFGSITGGQWLSPYNLRVVLQIAAVLGIMAIGQSLVIGVREIDISVGSVFGISGLAYLFVADIFGALPGVVAALALAAAIGCINGLLVAWARIPALIVTLSALFIFRGLCYALTEGVAFQAGTETRGTFLFQALGGVKVGGLNTAIFWAILLAVVAHVAISRMRFGNHLLAVGGDAASAYSRGVNVTRVKWRSFVLCSMCAGFAGVLAAGKLGFGDGTLGRLMELEAIAACVLGGCLLSGGRVSVPGVLVGAFMLSGIQSFLVIMGARPGWFMVLLGLVVVIAAISDRRFTIWLSRPG